MLPEPPLPAEPTAPRAPPGRGASRSPEETPLNAQRIIAAAVKLADTQGVQALTIRRLATELGAKPMTIYHYLPSKEAIIDGMVDAVFTEIELPPGDVPWKAALRARAISTRAALGRHPWATPLMESRRSPGPATLRHHDAVIGWLLSAGFSMALTAHAYALIDAFIYGFALQEAGLPATGQEMSDLAGSLSAGLPTERYPYLARFTVEHVLQPGYDFGAEFDFGLDLILDRLEVDASREQNA